MKKIIIFITVLFTIFNISYAQKDSVLKEFRVHSNSAFTYGEKLDYEISYGFITAAEAFLYVSPAPFVYNGRNTYEVNLDVNSRSAFEHVYKVRDSYKSYIDEKGIFPWRFEQHIRESNYKRDFEETFIQESLKVYTKINFVEDKNYKTTFYVQDLISSFYYARTLNWKDKKEGDKILIPTFHNDKWWNLEVRFEGREDVDVEAGEFRCFVVRPMLKEGFTTKTSDIYLYITDDERKVPVKVKLNIVIGAIVAELVSYSGLNGPLDAKIK
jgi:hypothetical protein